MIKELFYTRIIPIEDWRRVILPLKMENWTLIFVLKNITYIFSFLINFILLAVPKNQGFIWDHCSKKIQKKNYKQFNLQLNKTEL